ncbi:NAD-dependent epimerase/dehydratase family protein [Pseudomonas machongensis]
MKSLVIGSTSVIGKSIGAALSRLGEVRTAGRRDADFHLDLSQAEAALPQIGQVDALVMVAAAFGGPSIQALINTEQVNAIGTLRACQLAEQSSVRHMILISSISASYQPQDPHYGIYALSKRHAEELATLFCKAHGITLTILRPSQVYDAAGACRKHQALLYTIAANARDGQPVQLYGSNDARRNYLYLDDLAEIVTRVAQRTVGGQFDCVHPDSPRLSEIAHAAFAAYDRKSDVRFLVDKPDIADLPAMQCDERLHEAIDYWPATDIAAGMKLISSTWENQP